ncbi:complement C1q-like protein 2 [Plectropomus leopardus]|uniref:complement C1q-like protein 2 n=1 Tax=Plectropomus leopardus TaxID=160734 RepID=UPI001C4D7B46|nr:complement C1q-like protein 2 [Plectropomus leopardus]
MAAQGWTGLKFLRCEMRAITCTLLILSLLCDSVNTEVTINSLRAAAETKKQQLIPRLIRLFSFHSSTSAEAWEGELPCGKWDCECAVKHLRGCCCAARELQEVEDQIFVRVMDLLTRVSQLGHSLIDVIGRMRVAFTASLNARTNCFGPFTRNSPIPYDVVTLNHGHGYNPTLGIFTAPCSGLYSFSFSVYSKVGREGERIYHKVNLMRNGVVEASTWEDNREDSEDSSSQTVLLQLQQGGQVYIELLSGRKLCGNVMGLNTFSGSLVYPMLA